MCSLSLKFFTVRSVAYQVGLYNCLFILRNFLFSTRSSSSQDDWFFPELVVVEIKLLNFNKI